MPSSKASARIKAPRKKAPPRSPGAEAPKVENEATQGESASVGDLVAALGGDASGPSESAAAGDPMASPEEETPVAGDVDPAQAPDAQGEDVGPPGDAEAAEHHAAETQDNPPAVSARADGVQLADSIPVDPDDDLSKVEGEASPRLMSIVESILFASNKPMSVRDLRRLLEAPSIRQIQLALKGLIVDTQDRGVVLSQVAGGFRLRTNPDNARWVQRMIAGRPTRLSRSQLEALAVVAYRQPITKSEVDHVRGVDCGAVLKVLLDRDLIKYVGRKEEAGRPHLYGTTVKFLEFFNLRSLRDMPNLQEFQELSEESEATLRETLGPDDLDGEDDLSGQEMLDFQAATSGTPSSDVAASASQDETAGPFRASPPSDDDPRVSAAQPREHTAAMSESGERSRSTTEAGSTADDESATWTVSAAAAAEEREADRGDEAEAATIPGDEGVAWTVSAATAAEEREEDRGDEAEAATIPDEELAAPAVRLVHAGAADPARVAESDVVEDVSGEAVADGWLRPGAPIPETDEEAEAWLAELQARAHVVDADSPAEPGWTEALEGGEVVPESGGEDATADLADIDPQDEVEAAPEREAPEDGGTLQAGGHVDPEADASSEPSPDDASQ